MTGARRSESMVEDRFRLSSPFGLFQKVSRYSLESNLMRVRLVISLSVGSSPPTRIKLSGFESPAEVLLSSSIGGGRQPIRLLFWPQLRLSTTQRVASIYRYKRVQQIQLPSYYDMCPSYVMAELPISLKLKPRHRLVAPKRLLGALPDKLTDGWIDGQINRSIVGLIDTVAISINFVGSK